jgi:hypothetical protein
VATTTKTERFTRAVRVLGAITALVGLVGSGCTKGAAPPPAAEVERRPPPRALVDLAPAAGLRWLVMGRPRRIMGEAELAPSLATIVPPERLEAFAHSTGFRLDRVTLGAIAGYDFGTLYLAELDGSEAPLVRARFSEKLVDGGLTRVRSDVHRIVGTTASGDVRALVTVEDRYIAFATGDSTLVRIVEAYAHDRLRSPAALRGAGLRELPALSDDALIAFLAPGPFMNDWGHAADGVVASAEALSIVVTKASGGRLRAKLTLVGDWEHASEALAKLEMAWAELRQSPTGRLLGIEQAKALNPEISPQFLTLSAEFEIGPLARGLRAATSADVREILELDAPPKDTPP